MKALITSNTRPIYINIYIFEENSRTVMTFSSDHHVQNNAKIRDIFLDSSITAPILKTCKKNTLAKPTYETDWLSIVRGVCVISWLLACFFDI